MYELDIELEQEVVTLFPDPVAGEPRVFSVETRSSKGVRRVHHARNVVIASGAYDLPNLMDVPGEDVRTSRTTTVSRIRTSASGW